MAMPEMLGVSPIAPPPGRRYRTRLGGFCVVLAGLALMELSVTHAVKAVGYAADKGTVTVAHCRIRPAHGHTHESSVCGGVYRPAGGGTVRRDAEVDGWYVPGERVTVYRESSEYFLLGMRAFWGWLILFFFGMLISAHGMVTIVVGFRRTTIAQFAAARALVGRSLMAEPVKWLRRVGGVGALLCLVLALVTP
ncbi:hypothetical protein [Streptomyces griseocarneus]|uniref:hypothetical protein n=1 Tax=Streptomyces griseocarneus TaxID=51201 RepID=UPI00167C862F|nr:hypothetical protein [Streptomyces griseocarneus]MBZ6471886.1 hypothetical protein [Streptomyces griseocarneus]GHG71426.1 hypothetical protein GCM10018779_46080 [Streptomyces griseocarneus]